MMDKVITSTSTNDVMIFKCKRTKRTLIKDYDGLNKCCKHTDCLMVLKYECIRKGAIIKERDSRNGYCEHSECLMAMI